MLSEAQRHAMRHALGLTRTKVAYRNYYAATIGSPAEALWNALQADGLAERGTPGDRLVGFAVTPAGIAALEESQDNG